MKRLVVMLPFLLVTAGCVYPASSLSGAYSRQSPFYPRPYGPQVQLASLPVGRWDNVMMTAVGTPLFVLLMDGGRASGEVVSATSGSLRLHVASGEVDLAAADVMRIDRLAGGRPDLLKDGARGAAFGAGVVGVLGLIVGLVPPAHLFAAGGIIGAEQNIEAALAARGATIIYLARGVVPPGPGPRNAPQQPTPRIGARGPCGYGGSACNPQIRYRR